jgi:hypothetical protein
MAFDAGGVAFSGDPREDWIFSAGTTQECPESPEEWPRMPMASGSEAISPDVF